MTNRHRFRASWHDYEDGAYFITVCTNNKRHLFGNIDADNVMTKFPLGIIAEEAIGKIEEHHKDTYILNHVVMPNHIHMVLSIKGDGKTHNNIKLGCLSAPRHGDICNDFHHNSKLATVIGSFKAAVSRQARKMGLIATEACWQSRFHEHIIRDKFAFDRIMHYIDTNIETWATDCFR